jgi:hypothetical protein
MSDLSSFFNKNPWDGIESPCYPDGRRLYMNDARFWVSMNEKDQLLFFVHEEGIQNSKSISNFSSVDVEVDSYGGDASRLICTLTDVDDGVRDKFSIMAKEIAHSCSVYSGEQLFGKIQERINDWADFLRPIKTGLSAAEYLGLFGELYTLRTFILECFSPSDAVKFWVGPDYKKQDFTFNSLALEVKSTLVGGPNTVKISSLDQLDRVTASLYLLRLSFNYTNQVGSLTLESLYENCLTVVTPDFGAKALFLQKVSSLYGKATDEQLNKCLSLSLIQLYDVGDDFPCLTRDSIPQGIAEAGYEIYVSRIAEYEVKEDIMEIIKNG